VALTHVDRMATGAPKARALMRCLSFAMTAPAIGLLMIFVGDLSPSKSSRPEPLPMAASAMAFVSQNSGPPSP